jgi:hypothetical protein
MKKEMTEATKHKLSVRSDDEEWIPFYHPKTFTIEKLKNGSRRLVAGAPDGKPSTFATLLDCLSPPYYVLYVLHTPRGEGEPGRYQSPLVTADNVHAFLNRFSTFLTVDARYDLWAYSPTDKGTVVWERHNLVYAYGPLEQYSSALESLGFEPGTPGIPSPHQHHYRGEFDSDAKALLSDFEWTYTPLQPEDEQ